ncbi:MAG: hypothetical protein JW882_05815 [Deltaproteobacteria bacterium]|nr:hypothetical protein [Deltaproteobacteria bacterium]
MRKVSNYRIGKESLDDMLNAKRFNPSLEITFRDQTGSHTHKISAGYGDEIHVYREDRETFVLSQNRRLGYIGLEVLKGDEKVGEIFLQDHQVKEILGKDDLAPFTIIRRLGEYINP